MHPLSIGVHQIMMYTLWILTQKWYRQNMSLEFILAYFDYQLQGNKNFWIPTCIVLLRAEFTCTNKSSLTGRLADASLVAAQKANVRVQKFFFPWFCLIYGAKCTFSRDLQCLYHFWGWFHGVITVFSHLTLSKRLLKPHKNLHWCPPNCLRLSTKAQKNVFLDTLKIRDKFEWIHIQWLTRENVCSKIAPFKCEWHKEKLMHITGP